jgi:hypothetical protein
MTLTPEMLAAFFDGELDETARAEVEAALVADPALVRSVAAERALKARLSSAYDPIAEEAAPAHLIEAIAAAPAPVGRRSREPRWGAPVWAAMAACLVLGLTAGGFLFDTAPAGGGLIGADLGPSPELAAALDQELASQPTGGAVRIGVSFRDVEDRYCRTFAATNAAGLACKDGGQWNLVALAPASPELSGQYRTATSLPPAIAAALENLISGVPLDAEAEAAAKAQDWE